MKFFFCFRQVVPRPPGSWIARGPWETYDEAKQEREKAKAWDAEVGNVFSASSKAEADERCASGRTG